MKLAPQHRIFMMFFLFSLAVGALMSRLPDLQLALNVNKAELGIVLIGMAIGSLISLTLSSPVIVKIGARSTSIITLFGTTFIMALIPWLPIPWMVFAVLFVAGLLSGALEINLNVEISRLEAQLGFGIMNRAHGFWSVGFFIAASTASVIRQAGISIQMHLLITFVGVLILGGWALRAMQNAPAIERADEQKAPLIAVPTLAIMPLCVIGIAAFLVEGAGIDWSAIYMRDVFAVEPFIGGMGLTLFALFMSIARMVADPIVGRYGARLVARVMLSTAAIGLAMVWLAPDPVIALAGFALMGAGCSAVYPMAVTAAAARTDRPSHVNVAALGQMAFVVFFLGPPLLGFVAEHFGMRSAYLLCLPLIVLSLFSTKALADTK